MALYPAWCPTCRQVVFPRAGGVEVVNSTNVSIGGGTMCPNGQHSAEFLPGSFDFIGDIIRVVSAPNTTRARLRTFSEAFERAAGLMAIDPAAAVKEVAQVDPALGAKFQRIIVHPVALIFLSAILGALGTLITNQLSRPDPLTPDAIETIVRVTLEEARRVTPAPTSPWSSPDQPETDTATSP